jgi:arabinose-5-phosphate isomerase
MVLPERTGGPGSPPGALFDFEGVVRRALEIERDALTNLLGRSLDAPARAAALLHGCAGRIVVTGVGKTGLVGRKIAATLASTGTPAHFLHAGEAVHGDLGVVLEADIVLAISNSGETAEVVELLPHLKQLKTPIIALTGVVSSTLARGSDVVLDVSVDREADPLGMAPTASTTAALAMGDALAAALMAARGLTRDQYAQRHPGGSLGNILSAKVSDLMVNSEDMPAVPDTVTVQEAIYEMTSRRNMGATFITDPERRLVGILTDGDLRRVIQAHAEPLSIPVRTVMSTHPKSIGADAPAIDAMRLMEDHSITLLAVVDKDGRPVSAIHMHDLVKAGLAVLSADDE